MFYAPFVTSGTFSKIRPVSMPADLVWDAHAIELIREALAGALDSEGPAWSRTLGLSYAELQHLCAVMCVADSVQSLPDPELHARLLHEVPEIFQRHVAWLLEHRRSNLPVQNARWLAHAICWSCFAGESCLAHPERLLQPNFTSVTLRYFASLPV